MNKQRFIKILKVPGNLQDDLPDLQELQQNYPYAQAIHVLVALAHKQKNTNDTTSALNYAAMYVADRHNLKELISIKKSYKAEPEEEYSPKKIIVQEETGAIKQPGILPEPDKPIEAAPDTKEIIDDKAGEENTSPNKNLFVPKEQTEETGAAKKVVSEIGNKFRESLLKKLEKLQIAKEKWSNSFSSEEEEEEGERNTLVGKIAQTVKKQKEKKKQKKGESSAKESNESKNLKKPPEETSVKFSEDFSKIPETDPDPAKETEENLKISEETSDKIPEDAPDSFKAPEGISEEVSEDIEQDKIKKQQELISKFIEISPSIKAKANKPPIISADQEDLSVPSTSFKDNLISENLADIMVSQGKDDKAIDIYKKLIWKFPQKRAYFAARIEELTKKKG